MVEHVVSVLPEFVVACLALAVLPGPATALFLQRSLRDGRAAGLAAVTGNEIGVFGWAAASAAGLTALVAANRLLFDLMHLVGAAVLILLGVSAWRSARHPTSAPFGAAVTSRLPGGRSAGGAFRASLVTVAANPKAAVFAFSFFPQFLPAEGPVLPAALLLAAVQVLIDGAWCVAVVLLASRAREWLSRAAIRRRLERALGAILVGLGVQLAIETR